MRRQFIDEDGKYVISRNNRAKYTVVKNVTINVALDELEDLVKSIKAYKRSKGRIKNSSIVCIKHLSPDVSFVIVKKAIR